jgi:putative transposase
VASGFSRKEATVAPISAVWLPALAGRRRLPPGNHRAVPAHMVHPYPPHHDDVPYVGKYHYSLMFCTHDRRSVFVDAKRVELVLAQFLRAAGERQFVITAYCFMPDHVHLIVSGLTDDSDAKSFIACAKQYSAFYYKREHGVRVWQRYGFEHFIRDEMELALTIGYVIANPVRAGLVAHPSDYPYLGSSRWSIEQLLEICEYDRAVD